MKDVRCPRTNSILANSEAILFDLDGLLVDTEAFHWKAYQAMCERFGYILPWNFEEYLLISGSSAKALQEGLRQKVPEIFVCHTWEELYVEKKEQLKKLLESHPIPLMPGAKRCVETFSQEKKRMAVVTNSPQSFTDSVIRSHPFFLTISRWIFREKYVEPKPSPESYLLACKEMNIAPERALGFEDTIRGVDALLQAGCTPILVNARNTHFQAACREKNVHVIASLEQV
jgi:beta-phosphoglucomutase